MIIRFYLIHDNNHQLSSHDYDVADQHLNGVKVELLPDHFDQPLIHFVFSIQLEEDS